MTPEERAEEIDKAARQISACLRYLEAATGETVEGVDLVSTDNTGVNDRGKRVATSVSIRFAVPFVRVWT